MIKHFAEGDDVHRLFLLEILVENVRLDWKKINLDTKLLYNLKETCVRFQFLNYPVLEISEENFGQKKEGEDEKSEVAFKRGKSCLFSLRSVSPELRCFKIMATVLRKKESLPHHVFGKACINLGESFMNVINSAQSGNGGEPFAKITFDSYPIRIPSGAEIGKLTVLTRLSCFGKTIVTQFQITDEDKNTFFFKAEDTIINENNNVPTKKERCALTDYEVPSPQPVAQTSLNLQGPAPLPMAPLASTTNNYYQYGYNPLMEIPYRPLTPSRLMGGNPYGGYFHPMGLLGGNQENLFDFASTSPTEINPRDYKDIGLYVNGQPIDLRVVKQQKHPHPFCGRIPTSQSSSSSSEEQTSPQQPLSLPLGMQSPKKKNRNLTGNFCLKPDCPMGYPMLPGTKQTFCTQQVVSPGTIVLKEDQIVFQMPSLNT